MNPVRLPLLVPLGSQWYFQSIGSLFSALLFSAFLSLLLPNSLLIKVIQPCEYKIATCHVCSRCWNGKLLWLKCSDVCIVCWATTEHHSCKCRSTTHDKQSLCWKHVMAPWSSCHGISTVHARNLSGSLSDRKRESADTVYINWQEKWVYLFTIFSYLLKIMGRGAVFSYPGWLPLLRRMVCNFFKKNQHQSCFIRFQPLVATTSVVRGTFFNQIRVGVISIFGIRLQHAVI